MSGQTLTRTLRASHLFMPRLIQDLYPNKSADVHGGPLNFRYLTQPVYFQPRKRMFHIRPKKRRGACARALSEALISQRMSL